MTGSQPPDLVVARTVPSTPRGTIPLLTSRVRHVIKKRWWALLICVAVSGAGAWVAAGRFATYTWEAKAALLYTPVPVPESQKMIYTPPSLKTYLALVKSEENLRTLSEEFRMPGAVKLLEAQLKIELQTNTDMFLITFKWGDRKDALALTNRLMELFVERVAAVRYKRLDDNLTDLQTEFVEAERRLKAATEALQNFKIQEKVADPRNAVDRLNNEILALEAGLVTNLQNINNYQAQLTKLDKYIADLKTQDEKSPDKTFEAAEESLSDNRRRQDRLRELIQDEQKMAELRPLLEAKQKQLQRTVALQGRGAASQGEVERLRAEVGALAARVSDNEKVKQWKADLARIDEMVVPKGKQKKGGSPIIVQMLGRRLELELQVVAFEEERKQIDSNLVGKRQLLVDTAARQQRADALIRDVDAAEAQRQRIEIQRVVIRQLQGPHTREFTVIAAATTGTDPVASTKKMLLGGITTGGLLLSLLLLVVHDLLRGPIPVWEIVQRVGLPVLARLASPLEAGRSAEQDNRQAQELRALSLHLRQHLPEPGLVVLLTGVCADPGPDAFAAQVASFLARRDERVLLLDTRLGLGKAATIFPWIQTPPASSEMTRGLADYLTFACDALTEFVQFTPIPGVEYVSVGSEVAPSDLLATHRMRELMETLRARYSMVLILAPTIEDCVDLEILTAYADAVVLFLRTAGVRTATIKKFLASMHQRQAPLLGSVVIE